MRDLSKSFDQRTLGLILKNLLETFEEGDVDYQDSFDHYVFEGIDESLKILGIRANGVDEYTFYCQLARLNPDFEIRETIIFDVPAKNAPFDMHHFFPFSIGR